MADATKPQSELAQKTLPRPLYRALKHIFDQRVSGVVLAGGTALAGFYAGHRRSDDLDLFTANEPAERAAVLAARSLSSIGASLEIEAESAQYFEATAKLDEHFFKLTIVLDSALFRVGGPGLEVGPEIGKDDSESPIRVVDLDTLFKMKAATLVSRCSEKDLYDLIWLFGHFPNRKIEDLIRLGNEIDGGVNAEAVLGSGSGAILRKEACDFAPGKNPERVFGEILQFRQSLLAGLESFLDKQPAPELGKLIQELQKLRK